MYFNQFQSSNNVALHLSALTDKVDEVATRAGVSPFDRLDLEGALAALPWRERRRLALILEGTKVSANSEALRTAVDMIHQLASDTWARTPPPDHSGGKA
jgi:hypothetical protein